MGLKIARPEPDLTLQTPSSINLLSVTANVARLNNPEILPRPCNFYTIRQSPQQRRKDKRRGGRATASSGKR